MGVLTGWWEPFHDVYVYQVSCCIPYIIILFVKDISKTGKMKKKMGEGKLIVLTDSQSLTLLPQDVTVETQKICYIKTVHKMELLKLKCSGSLRLQNYKCQGLFFLGHICDARVKFIKTELETYPPSQ